ncbi:MAG: Uma2 family endonuclease [Frankia sp.]|nr:Uma2 family endonuclease [Frankia sp.]
MTTLPYGRPLTRADLELMPDDGHRYELLDGVLLVTPAPTPTHQRVAFELAVLLREACPRHLEVFIAPLAVALADDTELQPDVLVARRADLAQWGLPGPPLLAVEVLSPSTRRFDLMSKRSRFEAAGAPSYWVVDPDGPSIRAWDLRDGRYVEISYVERDAAFEATAPFAVTVVPATLVAEPDARVQ